MNAKPLYPVPPRTATIGMVLFLLALGILFAAALAGLLFKRFLSSDAPPPPRLHLPAILWLSTGAIIGAGLTISRALKAVRAERLDAFRNNLFFSLGLVMTFISIQTPVMLGLLQKSLPTSRGGGQLFGILFVLLLLHALHMLGGLVALTVIAAGALKGRYDHEHHVPVRNATWYLHFLDVVWLVMFASFWLVR